MSAVGADCGGERAPDWALNYFKVMQWEREARPVMRMDYTTARYKPPDYNCGRSESLEIYEPASPNLDCRALE